MIFIKNKKNKFKFKKKKQFLLFKKNYKFKYSNIKYIDYKDIKTLKFFLLETGKIIPARLTGVKFYFQKKLNIAIKRARFLALLPFIGPLNVN